MLFNYSEITAVAITPHSQVMLDKKSVFYSCIGRGDVHHDKNRSFDPKLSQKGLFSSQVMLDLTTNSCFAQSLPFAAVWGI